jgi:hypothetical protein
MANAGVVCIVGGEQRAEGGDEGGAIRAEVRRLIRAPGSPNATMTSTLREANPALGPPPASPNLVTVFAGLMLGMFLGAVNQTIIAPAMPRIVAELGGMQHYSSIVVSALLASTVIVPVVGKLSDLYGRKRFYVGGILVFMASSLVAGVAPNLGTFMVARVLERIGMAASAAVLLDITDDATSESAR